MHPAPLAPPPWTLLAASVLTALLWTWRIYQGVEYAHGQLTDPRNCGGPDGLTCETVYRWAYGYLGLNLGLASVFALLTVLVWLGRRHPRLIMMVLYGFVLCAYLVIIAAGLHPPATVASAGAVLAIMVLTCLPPTSRWMEARQEDRARRRGRPRR